ncbi:hypothetical protein COU14_00180 [Candidatus Kaiserbacteria bacterium CG10_big_fil_rev_8_21_14_0_10_44_10]|uniref:Uncharacterized protein n=1 Tax=Candidatus Kaiserbacteria bacterium CG10_big_fil_rev_8_21_14_0_10_44_10 TaxID=1974606 RepID=A0A2H0UIJ0_9BACT|nr:MAG: hypothetical protein COU14_00180 [Candidatus Kaiserbacteria bacterium CG10_big_fil_rev_8_21_14_0_10_44_10]
MQIFYIFVSGLAETIRITTLLECPALIADDPVEDGASEPAMRLTRPAVTARHRPRPNQHDPPIELISPHPEGFLFA